MALAQLPVHARGFRARVHELLLEPHVRHSVGRRPRPLPDCRYAHHRGLRRRMLRHAHGCAHEHRWLLWRVLRSDRRPHRGPSHELEGAKVPLPHIVCCRRAGFCGCCLRCVEQVTRGQLLHPCWGHHCWTLDLHPHGQELEGAKPREVHRPWRLDFGVRFDHILLGVALQSARRSAEHLGSHVAGEPLVLARPGAEHVPGSHLISVRSLCHSTLCGRLADLQRHGGVGHGGGCRAVFAGASRGVGELPDVGVV
mmetsp:Transcript_42543/g.122993  ORF Transcript_42543/g.122993 Transcript_42543/m.122993 type:complete len:254 (+) Transcript_42543:958-1719(+)